jgi:hypothetical protein
MANHRLLTDDVSPHPGIEEADVEPSAPADRPTIRYVLGWSLVGLVFAFFTSYAALARGIDLVEVWRVHHPGVHGVVSDIQDCDYDDNYYVVCLGRFTADDGSIVARPVRLLADFINPHPPVPARVAGAADDRAWADDYEPAWGGWVFLVLVTGAFTIVVLFGIGLGVRSLVRRR